MGHRAQAELKWRGYRTLGSNRNIMARGRVASRRFLESNIRDSLDLLVLAKRI